MRVSNFIGCLVVAVFLLGGAALLVGGFMWAMKGPPPEKPPVISNVEVTAVSPYSLKFSWDVDVRASGEIMVCGKQPSTGDMCIWHDLPEPSFHQEITISDFVPGERYKVTILANRGSSQGIFEINDIGTVIEGGKPPHGE